MIRYIWDHLQKDLLIGGKVSLHPASRKKKKLKWRKNKRKVLLYKRLISWDGSVLFKKLSQHKHREIASSLYKILDFLENYYKCIDFIVLEYSGEININYIMLSEYSGVFTMLIIILREYFGDINLDVLIIIINYISNIRIMKSMHLIVSFSPFS